MNPEQAVSSSERIDPYTSNSISSEIMENEIGLDEIIGILFQSRWFIFGITLLVFSLGFAYTYITPLIYSVDALVQVEERGGGNMKGFGELSLLLSGDSPTEAEIEILKSRAMTGMVVDQLKLDIIALPHTFPIIGRALARRYKGIVPAPPLFGLNSYAWGGEVIRVENFEVPEEFKNETFTLIALRDGAYRVSDKNGNVLLDGREGKTATSHGIALFVSLLTARPDTEFLLVKQSRIQTITELQKQLDVQEKGRKTGVLSLTLEGSNPKRIVSIVNALANNYLRQNVERRSEEAQKMLSFLNGELPRIRMDTQNAEASLSEYRSRTASLGMSIEAQSFVQSSAEVEKQITLLRFEKAGLEQRFTGDHPALATVRKKLAQMEADKQKVTAKIKHLPETELEAIRLERDAKVANEVYVLLLNKIQELSVAKAGTVGNVRIIDKADIPISPIKPKKSFILLLSGVFGFFLGIGLLMIRRSFFKVVENPDEVERMLNLTVYATIPHSNKIRQHKSQKAANKSEKYTLLAREFPKDIAMESIRSLRTSLQFALMESSNNIIAFSGPSMGVGKSFVSVNLAFSLAEAEKRVLLIDADMRKGYLHEYFDMARTDGLSGLISGKVSLENAIHSTDIKGLDFIPAGITPPNPAEILMSENFQRIINEVSRRYDIVILDTPPVLAVTDASIIGRHAGILFLVIRYARHPIREIEHSYKRLKQSGVRVQGVVFNDTPMSGKYGYRYGYGYGRYYGYGYGYGQEPHG
ncbi:putative tyrosine-protein kinase EpsB [Gammaproteobacteria bacterium]